MKPDLVINEPQVTGALRVELNGNIPLAQSHLQEARKVVGQMQAQYGIQERLTAGESGGYYTLTQRLPDGTLIEAAQNDTQASVRITAPEQSSTPSGESKSSKPEPKPYLWVGARIRWEDYPDDNYTPSSDALMVYVSEPGKNRVLANQYWDFLPVYFDNNGNFAPGFHGNLVDPTHTINLDTQDNQNDYFGWGGEAATDRYQYSMFDSREGIFSGGALYFSKHGLRMYTLWNGVEGSLGGTPYDPQQTPEKVAARQFPGWWGPDNRYLWDVVVVLDPEEGMTEPTSHRPEDRANLRLIQSAGVASGQGMVLSGEYAICIGSVGIDCPEAKKVLWGWDDERTFYPPPLRVDVEVRVGKAPDTVVQKFTLEVPRYNDFFRCIIPFGVPVFIAAGDCEYGGVNPHINNWCPTTILVDVEAGSIRHSTADADLPDCFTPDASVHVKCDVGSMALYIALFRPWTGVFPVAVGDMVYQFLLDTRNGQGDHVHLPRRTQSEVVAAAQAVIKDFGLYRYDVDTNVFKLMPDMPDWQTFYGNQERAAGYDMWIWQLWGSVADGTAVFGWGYAPNTIGWPCVPANVLY